MKLAPPTVGHVPEQYCRDQGHVRVGSGLVQVCQPMGAKGAAMTKNPTGYSPLPISSGKYPSNGESDDRGG